MCSNNPTHGGALAHLIFLQTILLIRTRIEISGHHCSCRSPWNVVSFSHVEMSNRAKSCLLLDKITEACFALNRTVYMPPRKNSSLGPTMSLKPPVFFFFFPLNLLLDPHILLSPCPVFYCRSFVSLLRFLFSMAAISYPTPLPPSLANVPEKLSDKSALSRKHIYNRGSKDLSAQPLR